MRSCAIFFRLNNVYSLTSIIPLNIDYRQRNLGVEIFYSLALYLLSKNFGTAYTVLCAVFKNQSWFLVLLVL